MARRGRREIGVGRGRAFALARLAARVGSAEHDGPGRLSFVPVDLHGRVARGPGRRDQRRGLPAARARFGGPSADRVHRHGRQVQRPVADRRGQQVFVRGRRGRRSLQPVPLDPAVRSQNARAREINNLDGNDYRHTDGCCNLTHGTRTIKRRPERLLARARMSVTHDQSQKRRRKRCCLYVYEPYGILRHRRLGDGHAWSHVVRGRPRRPRRALFGPKRRQGSSDHLDRAVVGDVAHVVLGPGHAANLPRLHELAQRVGGRPGQPQVDLLVANRGRRVVLGPRRSVVFPHGVVVQPISADSLKMLRTTIYWYFDRKNFNSELVCFFGDTRLTIELITI